MAKTLVISNNQNIIESPFHLKKPSPSLFVSMECREYPTFEKLYGFLNNKMGIKLRKSTVTLYEDEQTHYKNYLKKTKWNDEKKKYIKVLYSHSKHGWGRVQAERSLSGSLFHRPTRHSFFQENYLDFDIVNCQIQIVLEFGKRVGLVGLDGLETYCRDPKQIRREIAEYYQLQEIKTDNGVTISPYEQAKKLPIRLAFGGGIRRWKTEFGVTRTSDLPLIVKIEKVFKKICLLIVEANPHLKKDL
jgi:hypothetical protein